MKSFFSRSQWIVLIAFFFGVFFLLYYTFFTSNDYSYESPIQFEIRNNEPLSKIAANLENQKIIPSSFNFKIAAFIYGAEKKIKAARYKIPNGLSYIELLDLFTKGDADYLRKVVILPGHTIQWIASRLKWSVFVDSSNFVNKTKDEIFTNFVDENTKSLEGYLLPGKYYFYENSSPVEIIEAMLDSFKTFWSDSLEQRSKELGFSKHEILTLASIVDGETNMISEMPIIAGVYLNRLRIGMKLQADPTVQYLLNGNWRRLLNDDLKINSPYNTYLNNGLPPGPINNPGKKAILACLFPDKHNYLYFVADTNGGHTFSKTFNEHLKKVNNYRQWLKKKSK